MARAICFFGLLCAVVAGLVSPAGAASDTSLAGGPGGGAVHFPCGVGALVGVGARYGAWLDWAGPMCVKVTPEGHWDGIPFGNVWVPPAQKSFLQQVASVTTGALPWNLPKSLEKIGETSSPLPGMGGDGGTAVTFAVCPQDSFVYGFDVTVIGGNRNVVARLKLRCHNMVTGAESVVGLPAPDTTRDGPYIDLAGPSCKTGSVAIGIQGRSGLYVDAFGLVCGNGSEWATYCSTYADKAISATVEASQEGCGFTGGRWSQDRGDHFNWCWSVGSGNRSVVEAESQARADQIIAQPCHAAKTSSPGTTATDEVVTPAPVIPPESTAPLASDGDFGGVWDLRTVQNAHFKLTLHVDGDSVTGEFVNLDNGIYNGTLTGTAKGGKLPLTWVQPQNGGATGTGTLHVHTDNTLGGAITYKAPGATQPTLYRWYGTRLAAAAPTTPAAATVPDAGAGAAAAAATGAAGGGQFDKPVGPHGLRLYACTTIDGTGCEKAAAQAFCQAKGFAKAVHYHEDSEATTAETLTGEACNKKECRVFVSIVCQS
jgi:hypothetical protein